MHSLNIMTHCEIIRNNLNKSDWEMTKDKCDSTRPHRRHLAVNGKHENKRNIYCTNVHLRIIESLITLMYKLSTVTLMPLHIPVTNLIVGYTVFLELLAPIYESTFVGGCCGLQLNTCQPTSSNIYLLSTNADKMFSPLSSSTTRSNYTPIINTRAPLSTPSILTKHVKSIPENMAKNDFVYHQHDKNNNKTTNKNEAISSYRA